MEEAAVTILTSDKAVPVLVTAAILIIVAILAAKKGLFTLNTAHLRVGIADTEREIVRNQQQWVRYFLMSREAKLPQGDRDYNGYYVKYVLKCLTERVEDWITYNHITDKEAYLHIKQSELRNLVYTLVDRKEFKTEEFANQMNEWTKEIIENLLAIRAQYK